MSDIMSVAGGTVYLSRIARYGANESGDKMTRSISRLGLAFTALALTGLSARGEELVGLSYSNPAGIQQLIRFDSATPGVSSSVNITGLITNDQLVGIDRRPSDGMLYGISFNNQNFAGRIYTLNAFTGAATLRSTLFADPTDMTAPFPYQNLFGLGLAGVDFNPIVDRLRVVSTGGFNLRINADTGAVQLDVPATYPVGDPGNPFPTPVQAAIGAVAYSNNFPGATTTVLTGVDGNRAPDHLVRFTDPNAGAIVSTGVDVQFFQSGANIDYDISGLSGLSYLVGAGPTGEELYVSGPNGFIKVGAISPSPFAIDVRGLAAPVPEPSSVALIAVGLALLLVVSRRRRNSRRCADRPSAGHDGAYTSWSCPRLPVGRLPVSRAC